MFAKTCCKCSAKATVEMEGQYFCTGHAFDKIVASKTAVPLPKRVK